MDWWVDIASSGFAGFIVAGAIALAALAVALIVVFAVLTGLLHAVGFLREGSVAFSRRWQASGLEEAEVTRPARAL